MQSFVVLLVCESIDQSTFCMKRDSTSYKIWISVSAFTKTYKTTKMVFNTYNSVCETKLCGIII